MLDRKLFKQEQRKAITSCIMLFKLSFTELASKCFFIISPGTHYSLLFASRLPTAFTLSSGWRNSFRLTIMDQKSTKRVLLGWNFIVKSITNLFFNQALYWN